ncbi:MAG TPA: L,D-transpeptidase family protein [Chthoniobacter sp.]|nr:L,D-transpeptidase family protein [Chthoniobacter sp.]
MRLLSLLAFCIVAATASAVDLTGAIPANCGQVVLVTASDWSVTTGSLRRYERADAHARWQPVGAPVEVLLGKHGLAWGLGLHGRTTDSSPQKAEGDLRAPAGVFVLGTAFGRASREDMRWLRFPYLQLTATTEAVDDPASRYYNRIIDRAQVAQVDWKSSERMADIPVYELGIEVAHNPEHVARAGSAIFIHLWPNGKSGTAGCTALHRADLLELLHWIDAARHPVLVQLPQKVARDGLNGF